MASLCRHHKVDLGIATDGRWWALVWAPRGGVTTSAVFDAITWPEVADRVMVRAFISLLRRKRFFQVPVEEQLPALLEESGKNQEDVTDALGVQVRQAVELLVDAVGRADAALRGQDSRGLADVHAHDVYRGAVAVMMRVVFLLFAREAATAVGQRRVSGHVFGRTAVRAAGGAGPGVDGGRARTLPRLRGIGCWHCSAPSMAAWSTSR